MLKRTSFYVLMISVAFTLPAHAQVLTIKEAVQTALTNYPAIKAKASYVNASKASVKQSINDYLPDFNISFQQDYGTINGQSGPLYGYRGLSVASGGPALSHQNWNAAFGALYLANINWDFFSFGRAREKIKTAKTVQARDESDLVQEQFQHQVRVAAAYLNLLAAQRLTRSWQNNLQRAETLRSNVVTRAKNGLIAGVDSSQANAEVSSARISLTRAIDAAQEQANQLAQLMGVPAQDFELDTSFIIRVPVNANDTAQLQQHPLLKFYQNRIAVSDEQARYFHTFNYPTFSAFGIIQSRGSGFDFDYGQLNQNLSAYKGDYWSGVKPIRSNYLLGVGMVWNLTQPLRIKHQVASQKFVSKGLQDEYELVNQQLKARAVLADNKMKNALSNYAEAPVQVKAASDAYLQKSVLYKNGLTTIIDVTQALYIVNRAETDRDIANVNVWQALLLKAAAGGDFGLFINEF
ncbi:TolC family protein [Foetidibacter luteolus]|uniref:TolC family protein n=1 Tax=Foetidibacter luteolus TaxID=2608880 RepID=UPI00129BBDA5|nr:TolC family protein [Foetidibacter luteolus]